MAKSFIGMEIGSGFIRLAQCDNGLITMVAIEPMPEKYVVDGRIVSDAAMSDFIRETVKKHGFTAKQVAYVLRSSDAYVRRLTLPPMTVDQLELNLPYEFRDYISESKDKYRFDYAMIDFRRDETGEPLEMDLLAAAAPIETIDTYASMVRHAGMRLKVASPDVMGYANIIAANSQPGAQPVDYCFLDLGCSVSKVYLFPGGKYEAVRLVDFGSDTIVAAIADAYDIDFPLARTYLQTNYEDVQHLQMCRDLYERMGIELSRIVNFYNFNFRDSNLTAVHCGGPASVIMPLIDELSSHISIELRGVGELIPAAPEAKEIVRLCPASAGITLA